MRPPRSPARASLAGLAAALGGLACGGTLYSASGIPPLESAACPDPTTHVCPTPSGPACVPQGVSACGSSCAVCSGAPAGVDVCAPAGGDWACTFECPAGLLKSGSGCAAAAAVAAGDAHTCAVTADGRLKCWGANDAGQVTGTAVPGERIPVPRDLVASGVATAPGSVAAGRSSTCAVVAGGGVLCFGSVGAPPPLGRIRAVAVGASHACALHDQGAAVGRITCWGATGRGQVGGASSPAVPVDSGATALAAGDDHTCALFGAGAGGAVRCWGDDSLGQLGDGTTGGFSAAPVTAIASGIASVGAGRAHTCAATGSSNGQAVDDSVRCWGDAPGTLFSLQSPQPSPAIPLKQAGQSTIRFAVSALAAGRTHTCVLRSGEDAQCFGPENGSGQLGGTPAGGPTEAVPVANTGPAAAAVAAGTDHGCAIAGPTLGSRLACWGLNGSGQLGDGTLVTPASPGPVPVSGL